MTRAFLVLIAIGCGGKPADDCACHPTHAPSAQLVDLLHRHARAVDANQRNGRDTKLIDDEIRVQSALVCDPCNAWVGERAKVDELYPMDRLDDATAATCMGLVLRDGATVFGAARSCRP